MGRNVMHQRSSAAQVHHERIHFPVVVVVPKAGPPRRRPLAQHRAGIARHIRELAAPQPAKQRVLLRNQVNQPAVKNQNVREAVVVEVVDARAPAHVLRIGLRDAGLGADIFKAHLARVVQQPVIVPVGDPQVQQAAPFEIGKHRAHRRSGFSILSEGRAGVVGHLLEGPVVLVVKEEVLRAIVGHVDVVPAVVVEIRRRHAHGAAHESADARLVRNVRKCSIAVVVIQLVGLALVIQRPRIIVRGIIRAILGIELHIAADKQVHAAVLVVVQPGGADGPSVHLDARLLRHVGEVPVAVVVIQNGLAVPRHQQIDEPVVVKVRRRHGHRVEVRIQSRLFRYVRELSIAVVAIKVIVRHRIGLHLQRIGMHRVVQRASVDHVERFQPGVVVVEPDAARSRAFQKRTQLPRPETVREMNPRLVARIFKPDHRRLHCGRPRLRRLRCGRRRLRGRSWVRLYNRSRGSRLRRGHRDSAEQKKKAKVHFELPPGDAPRATALAFAPVRSAGVVVRSSTAGT